MRKCDRWRQSTGRSGRPETHRCREPCPGMASQTVERCFENETRRWQWETSVEGEKRRSYRGRRHADNTTTNAFLAFAQTPLIVDAPFSACDSMQKSLRTAVIVLLSIGLLALFLRGAHLDVVWTEIRQANPWLIALSAAVTVLTMVLAGAAVAVPARTNRPRAVCGRRFGRPRLALRRARCFRRARAR